MLKPAYLCTTETEINDLINTGNYKYLNLMGYDCYELIQLQTNNANKLQYVSVNWSGEILGYFEVSKSLFHNKFEDSIFVKFKHTYDIYGEDNETAYNDFCEFQNMIFSDPMFTGVEIRSVVDNPANKLYEKWLDKYNGRRILLPNYIKLQEGKYYDCYLYWFEGRGV